jgi:hypothetical protein
VADAYRAESFNPIRWAFNEYEPSPTVNLDHPYFARSAPRSMLIEEMREAYAGDAKSSARPGINS